MDFKKLIFDTINERLEKENVNDTVLTLTLTFFEGKTTAQVKTLNLGLQKMELGFSENTMIKYVMVKKINNQCKKVLKKTFEKLILKMNFTDQSIDLFGGELINDKWEYIDLSNELNKL